MTSPRTRLAGWYAHGLLRFPGTVLALLVLLTVVMGWMARDFRMDASTESLMIEDDPDLRYAREVAARYGLGDFLLVAFAPAEALLSDATLATLEKLQKELERLPGVSSVVSILDLPLLESPAVPLKELAGGLPTLRAPGVDRRLAAVELAHSPLYRNLLVSPDLAYTALQINFAADGRRRDLLERRSFLRARRAAGPLSGAEAAELAGLAARLRRLGDEMRENQHRRIAAVRDILDRYRGDSRLFLGGLAMIADDMITFIKNDLKVFGLGVFLLLVLTLAVLFRKPRWIVLPLACCIVAVVFMTGFLGLFGLEVTVISSNFVSLQLIMTMAMAIHLIVRYRELSAAHPDVPRRERIAETVRTKIRPCVFAVLTTIAGFGSLLLCDILPVIHFGWMMSAGILVSLVVTFVVFPAGLMLLGAEGDLPGGRRGSGTACFTGVLAAFTERHGTAILAAGGFVLVFSAAGISRLTVENSFIDYFKHSTEIYRGMKAVDENLGGTTPMDVIVRLEAAPDPPQAPRAGGGPSGDADFEMFDEFETSGTEAKYWFTPTRMQRVLAVHDYLEGLPEVGKVLSLGTAIQIARRLNDGNPLDTFQMALLYTGLPERLKAMLLTPYLSIPDNEVRFALRIRDSSPSLRRDALLKRIRADLVQRFDFPPENVRLSGVMVLYNNMLQGLFRSQILTFGAVLAALLAMFLVLFRSLKVALVALFPNLLASCSVLGVMGWLGIPLDMMTITIAAISIGIAVDNTIHYIDRFQTEIRRDHDYHRSLRRCHATIGQAVFYTSVTIVIGFSILVFSNFIPTIYFGLFTSLAMLVALIAALTLLPRLLMLVKPF